MRAPIRQPEVDHDNNLAATANFLLFFACAKTAASSLEFHHLFIPKSHLQRKVSCALCANERVESERNNGLVM
jgi:hypothetical protein